MTLLAAAASSTPFARSTSPTHPIMSSNKLRVALYFRRNIDLEAYRFLVETISSCSVVLRRQDVAKIGTEIESAGVDLALVDASLLERLPPGQLEHWSTIPNCSLAVVASERQALIGDAEPTVLSEAWQLTCFLSGRPLPDTRPTDVPLRIDGLGITTRERQVWRLIAAGDTVRGIADHLGLAESTVDSHKSRLMRKLGVHKSVELVRLAVRLGLVDV